MTTPKRKKNPFHSFWCEIYRAKCLFVYNHIIALRFITIENPELYLTLWVMMLRPNSSWIRSLHHISNQFNSWRFVWFFRQNCGTPNRVWLKLIKTDLKLVDNRCSLMETIHSFIFRGYYFETRSFHWYIKPDLKLKQRKILYRNIGFNGSWFHLYLCCELHFETGSFQNDSLRSGTMGSRT